MLIALSNFQEMMKLKKLAKRRWLEEDPEEEIATWLDHKLKPAGQKTIWAAVTCWVLPIKMPDVVSACLLSALSMMIDSIEGHIKQSAIPLQQWLIDYFGHLPLSEGSKYALTCVDTVTFPRKGENQKATIKGLI